MRVDSDFLASGQRFPPGFRFHPTDEELVLYYLKRKICGKPHRLDVVTETDVYKWDPEELPGMSKLKTGDRQWFFLSPKDRKYPNGARSNRGTRHGYWKATGKDRIISYASRTVGIKKTLVFYRGRAPNGERTDWVMHEYTIKEEELKACKNFKEYYALYKVYKKSGPGPKNGEQYGALFREEEWDEEGEVQHPIEQEKPIKHADETMPVDDTKTLDCQQHSSLDDLEEFLNRVETETESDTIQTPVACRGYALDQFVGEDETPRTLVDYSTVDFSLPVIQEFIQPSCVAAPFAPPELGTSQLQSQEAPEPFSIQFDNNMQDPNVAVEEFFQDFLEMNDLESDPLIHCHDNQGNNLESLQFDDLGGFNDMYEVASSFHCRPSEPWQAPQQFVNNVEDGVVDPSSSSFFNSLDSTTQNCLILEKSNNSIGANYQQWSYEPTYSVVTTEEVNQDFHKPSTSGASFQNPNNVLANHSTEEVDNGRGERDDETESWFSSAAWAFVESIPTKPASASEGVSSDMMFERTSSPSRVRVNAGNENVTATSRKSRIGFLCFSILGVCWGNSNSNVRGDKSIKWPKVKATF